VDNELVCPQKRKKRYAPKWRQCWLCYESCIMKKFQLDKRSTIRPWRRSGKLKRRSPLQKTRAVPPEVCSSWQHSSLSITNKKLFGPKANNNNVALISPDLASWGIFCYQNYTVTRKELVLMTCGVHQQNSGRWPPKYFRSMKEQTVEMRQSQRRILWRGEVLNSVHFH
jgi:hypothetical protein